MYLNLLIYINTSNKRSTSPGRGSGSKCFKGGSGWAPSSNSRQGFRKWESYPCPILTGRSLSLHRQTWRDRGVDPWVVEVLRFGYRIPFLRVPPLSKEPIPLVSYSPTSTKGIALEGVTLSLVEIGAVNLALLPSPGFYSRMLVVRKTSGSWRPVIDLSVLIRFVLKTPFKRETGQSVRLSVRQGDWMVSVNLKEAYLQVPVHPDSRKYLWFVTLGKPYQFRALCLGLSTAPQVFTRVMTPISSILISLCIRMPRYLVDWFIQASSREAVLQALSTVLSLC